MRRRSAFLAALAVVVAAGCSSTDGTTVETTIAEGPDTLYDVTTTVANGAAIAGGVADDVATGLGLTFTDAQRTCITGALSTAPGTDALKAYAANPALLAQPQQVQDATFAAVDQCVTPDGYASIAAPGLVAAGASEKSATCYFSTIRDELGTAALYRYFVESDGETPDTTAPAAPSGTDEPGTDQPAATDPGGETPTTVSRDEAERVVTRTYRTCGINRERLAATTTTEAPTTSEAATTSNP